MGRLAQLAGVGVKGNVRLWLETAELTAGDVVRGSVQVHVQEEILAKDIVVSFCGIEDLFSTTYDKRRVYHHRQREFFTRVVPVTEASTLLSPGDYVFPFVLPLPVNLPGSFSITGYSIDGWVRQLYDIRASIIYGVSAKLRVKGALVADLATRCMTNVVPQPPQLKLHSLSASVSRHVRFMGVFPRSRCHLSVSINQNVYAGGTALYVNFSVHNESSTPVSSISISIFEDFSVKPFLFGYITRSASNCVCMRTAAGLLSGERRDDVAVLALTYSTGQPLRRTTKAKFTEWSYCLVVRCHFAMSSSVSVELPIMIV